MRNSVLFSVAAHSAIVVLALATFPTPEELPSVSTRALPVDLITIDEMTNLKRQEKVEKPLPPVEEPEPPKAIERPQAEARPAPAPPPPPEREPEPIPDKTVEKKDPPKPVEKKVEKPAPPKKEPERKFDPNQIAALLNKAPDAASKPQPAPRVEEAFDAPRTDDPSMRLTLSEMDAFKVQMRRCWSVPAGAPNAEQLVVRIKVYLNQDGSLARPPELMDRTKLITGGAYYQAAADSAMRAIRLCQPFTMPADKFASWREIDLRFDPREMLGG
ncbi:hypothetical protein [Parvibaculum sp.]|uniref:hypothetical protein n=1 Tax=Parvibaculum sp. TaxID=2024848 RepID=UPI001D2162A6|nr:hypothetical protein [Parvibaculum sp.]MBX3488990.1 hypothetical protein [Parvibaculum sp.]MCW5727141.1 hypothetical protein [Parvibaculum sp.]